MNTEQAILVKRLKEVGLHTRRFLKLLPNKHPLEKEWEKNPYEPSELEAEGYKRWGIIGRTGLVCIDKDTEEMQELVRKILPPTLEILTPRRGLTHSLFAVTDLEVPNKDLFFGVDEKGKPKHAGEVRAQNKYLVAAGSEIEYKVLDENGKESSEEKTGRYTILHDRPIAKVKYADFMKALEPHFAAGTGQKITFKQMREGVGKGCRHDQGIKLATFLCGIQKLDPAAALQAMREWNKLNRPPMTDHDLMRMVQNASAYVARKSEIGAHASELGGRDIYSDALNIFEITVKGDRRSIEFILPAGISAYVGDPDNLGLEAPTSEGKTYPTIEVLKHFPPEDVWFLGGLSPTALAHDKGALVGEDNQPIAHFLRDLNKEKRKAKKEKDEDRVAEIDEKLHEIYSKSKYLIEMGNKILVFLEAPQRDTFARLRPIFSHDVYEITYKFTDKSGRGQLRTNTVVVRGWPAVIYLKAGKGKEDDIWPEIQSRFSTISPTMTGDKYREAIRLNAMRKGLPEGVFKQKLGLDAGARDVEKWILAIKKRLVEMVETARKATGEPAPNIFWIPFYKRIGEGFPATIGRHMRDSKRFIKAMQMSAAINVFARPILKIDGVENIIVVMEDYRRAVRLFFENGEELFSGIPGHVIAFFKRVVLPEWDAQFARMENVQQKFKGGEERPGGLTSAGLAEAYKRTHAESRKTISANTINRYYLAELENAGLMSKETDRENPKRYVWCVLRRDIIPEEWCKWVQNENAPEFPLEMLKEGIKELKLSGARKLDMCNHKVQQLEIDDLHDIYYMNNPPFHAPDKYPQKTAQTQKGAKKTHARAKRTPIRQLKE